MVQVKTQNVIKFLVIFVALCQGCSTTSTVTPDLVESREASYDATTPPQYPARNSGILFQTKDARGEYDGVVLTEGGRDFYYSLCRAYAIQYKSEHKLDVGTGNEIKAFKDQYGNQLWWLHNQYFTAFLIMQDWLKSRRDPDSLWQRAKEKISPL